MIPVNLSVKRLLVGLSFLASSFVASAHLACDYRDQQSEFQHADAVFLAHATSVQQSPAAADGSAVESAVFQIDEVFKGEFTVGQMMRTRTPVAPMGTQGDVGKSVYNKPQWILEPPPPRGFERKDLVLSGRWLIYAEGREPYRLLMCSLTHPVEWGWPDPAELRTPKSSKAKK